MNSNGRPPSSEDFKPPLKSVRDFASAAFEKQHSRTDYDTVLDIDREIDIDSWLNSRVGQLA